MKREGARIPFAVILVALLALIIAVGTGLEGRLSFAGALLTPGQPTRPVVKNTPPPADLSTPVPAKAPHVGSGITFSLLPILIILGCLVVAVLAILIVYIARRRVGTLRLSRIEDALNEDLISTQDEPEAHLPTLHRGLVRASDVLETEREPRDAIVRAWLGLQEAAEDSGVIRRPSETPTEFTTRVFESVDADRRAATDLLGVYLRVRFRAEPASIEDVVVARDAIDRLRATWPARTPE